MKNIIFLVDGFNLYHSILELKRYSGSSKEWIDLSSLCKSYLHLFGTDSKLKSIYYFTAIPNHLKGIKLYKIKRHQNYLACLKNTGIQVILGRFKKKDIFCKNCMSWFKGHEEKETDVAIAIKLLEICLNKTCDIAVIISGDTDLSPAVKTCKSLFPTKEIIFVFPYRRKNLELAKLVQKSFTIDKNQYIKYQFPKYIILKNGRKIYKPIAW